ncbi:hypothetical protein LOK49_LG03G01535 [Camellia lanceoleosa]|uniref:Uncharacterized protein n=1 Tax=Camellia lanceoleosa TaxID=1840588 RepID=A0ACC0I6B3_9ERIC|nr:hypothetical protein LOK49_LG03G01535 [Camellia lanceoleosa]
MDLFQFRQIHRQIQNSNLAATQVCWIEHRSIDLGLFEHRVKLIHSYIIKTKNVWFKDLPQDSSSTLQKLFDLRILGQRLIKCIVGSGADIFLWLDNWQPIGPSYQRFVEKTVRIVGGALLAKVDSIIHNGTWNWPRIRNRAIQPVITHTLLSLKPNVVEDSMTWVPATNGDFSVKSAWNANREVRDTVPWHDFVWFNKYVP